ncbi:hypothetical protein N9I50_00590, partial [bacterium]|nr:hypothetical protein [bacterium]
MSKLAKSLTAAAGNAGESLYVEDVFSTYLYDGNSSNPITINNGIDFAGEGGLFWNRDRNTGYTGSVLLDTERGTLQTLATEQTSGNVSISSNKNVTYNNNGITIQAASSTSTGVLNFSNYSLCSWSFRKAEKFFDIVTYTGTGSARTVAHNLGSVPACIIVKRTDIAEDWRVYHVGLDPTDPEDYGIELNNTNARANQVTWNNTAPTDSVFSLSQYSTVNGSGGTYVAYLFASDAGGFGDDGDENIIKCGSFTTDGSSDAPLQNIGFEPQWIMTKSATGTADWYITDSMRDMSVSSSRYLIPNSSSAETLNAPFAVWVPHAQGFSIDGLGTAGETHIYIA